MRRNIYHTGYYREGKGCWRSEGLGIPWVGEIEVRVGVRLSSHSKLQSVDDSQCDGIPLIFTTT